MIPTALEAPQTYGIQLESGKATNKPMKPLSAEKWLRFDLTGGSRTDFWLLLNT